MTSDMAIGGHSATTTTFLFTDIAGSTRLWAEHREAMGAALARHDALLRAAVEDSGGTVFKTVGDAVCAAFPDPLGALAAVVAGQRALAAEPWADSGVPPLRVRMALHTGIAEHRDGDWFGQSVNRVARLLAIGHGGQVLVSLPTAELVADSLPAGVALRDLGEHRLKDLSRPERVFQVLHSELEAEFPPLSSLDARPNNLPPQATTFVGRVEDLEAVRQLLDEHRLVTITGAGGSGKTRLAIQAAAEIVDAFPSGAWFVDLAPISEPSLVVQTVAAVLAVDEQPGLPVETAVADRLRRRDATLIVLDNCEHVLDACARLAVSLLDRAPVARVLATSREPLRVPGETIWPIAPLGSPDPTRWVQGQAWTADDVAALTQFDAVRLFVDRACAGRPDFAVSPANAGHVAEICRRLDGIPLAIELAAARIRLLSPDQLARRLDDRFRLLTGGARTALPRQQTLQALIDWSYDLLDDAERTTLQRLSVFAGAAPLEAVLATCADGDLDEMDVLENIGSLVEKSLVVAQDREDTRWFRLLDTIRLYAAARLAETEGEDPARTRLLTWLEAFSMPAANLIVGANMTEWGLRLSPLRETIRATYLWGITRPEHAAAVVDLAGRLWWFLGGSSSHCRDARHVLGQLVERAPPEASPQAMAALNYCLGSLDGMFGEYELSLERFALALEGFRATGDGRGEAWAWQDRAAIHMALGQIDEAQHGFEAALALKRRKPVPTDVSVTLNWLGEVCRIGGDGEAAFAYLEEAESLLPIEDQVGVGFWPAYNLGAVHLARGDLAAAGVWLKESLRRADMDMQLPTSQTLAVSLLGHAELALAQRSLEQAIELLVGAQRLFEEDGRALGAIERFDLSRIEQALRSTVEPAAWDAEWAAGRTLDRPALVTLAKRVNRATVDGDSDP